MRHIPLLILTGPVHAGKTTFLQGFLEEQKKAGLRLNGILSVAHFEMHTRLGYDALDLRTGDRFPLLRKFSEPGWTHAGPYGVVPEGLVRAKAVVCNFRDSDLCVIDEMGPLELSGEGFWPCFLELRERRRPVLTVVRQDLVKPFSHACGVKPKIFRLDESDLAPRLRRALNKLRA
jgi:nucleoside-triphosphatase THEP1